LLLENGFDVVFVNEFLQCHEKKKAEKVVPFRRKLAVSPTQRTGKICF